MPFIFWSPSRMPLSRFIFSVRKTGKDGHVSIRIIEETEQLALVVIKMGEELLIRHTYSYVIFSKFHTMS